MSDQPSHPTRLFRRLATPLARLRQESLRALQAVGVCQPTRALNDPYATHLPVLIGISRLGKIRDVLELGCGLFSTALFLDRSVFPYLVRLDSFETSQHWADRVMALPGVNSDPRWHVQVTDRRMAEAVGALNLKGYDLVFIDDSTDVWSRSQTIRQVILQSPESCLIVIHDFEVPEYRQSAKCFRRRYVFRALRPQTGILWVPPALRQSDLRRLARAIRLGARTIDLRDVKGWTDRLSDVET